MSNPSLPETIDPPAMSQPCPLMGECPPPEPAVEPALFCDGLGVEVICYQCGRYAKVVYDFTAVDPLLDGCSCEWCGASFDGCVAPVGEYKSPTPESLAFGKAQREAAGLATERVHARVAAGEPAHPPILLCATCEPKRDAPGVSYSVTADIERDRCAACGEQLAANDAAPPTDPTPEAA